MSQRQGGSEWEGDDEQLQKEKKTRALTRRKKHEREGGDEQLHTIHKKRVIERERERERDRVSECVRETYPWQNWRV